MKIYNIGNYRVHLSNKKKPESNYSKFIVYKNGVKGDLDGGYLRWENEDVIVPRLTKVLKERDNLDAGKENI